MAPRRVFELERHSLAGGGIARVTRFGRKYGFMRSFPAGQAPEIAHNLTKEEAYRRLEDCLNHDVMETGCD